MAKDNAAGDKAEKAPKKSKKKLLILVAAAAIAVAAAGGFMMLGGGAKKGSASAKPSSVPGGVVALTAVTVNLADGHYLKVQVALQQSAGVPSDEDASEASDLTISEFSNRTVAELSSLEGRDKVKADLLSKLQKAYPNRVLNLYFTQFVMQ